MCMCTVVEQAATTLIVWALPQKLEKNLSISIQWKKNNFFRHCSEFTFLLLLTSTALAFGVRYTLRREIECLFAFYYNGVCMCARALSRPALTLFTILSTQFLNQFHERCSIAIGQNCKIVDTVWGKNKKTKTGWNKSVIIIYHSKTQWRLTIWLGKRVFEHFVCS